MLNIDFITLANKSIIPGPGEKTTYTEHLNIYTIYTILKIIFKCILEFKRYNACFFFDVLLYLN